jgi:hypothetical protein
VKDNLIVFITPTIVQDEDFQPTTTDFLKTPVPRKDSIEGPWSSWDSGKPRDWSKPQSDPDKFGAMPPASSTDTSRAGATPPSASNNSQKTPASSTAASTTEPDKFAALPPASSTK